ncbi:hypothetical protein K438DRAFT_1765318 [Mycena galopus ATCC 62051]|nr:hypothetical protein K438DRAFT_1765318 [Mycena galopus ATCC 62051]
MEMYAQGMVNAIEKAGFNGIKTHRANRYFIDRFLHLGSNFCTNEYGGSIENWVRFALEVTEAIGRAMGQKKTGFQISPSCQSRGYMDLARFVSRKDMLKVDLVNIIKGQCMVAPLSILCWQISKWPGENFNHSKLMEAKLEAATLEHEFTLMEAEPVDEDSWLNTHVSGQY